MTIHDDSVDLLAEAVIATPTTPHRFTQAGVAWVLRNEAAELWLEDTGRSEADGRLALLAAGFMLHHAAAVLRSSGYEALVTRQVGFGRVAPLATLRRGRVEPPDWALYRTIFATEAGPAPVPARRTHATMNHLRDAVRRCGAEAYPVARRGGPSGAGEPPPAWLLLCAAAAGPGGWLAAGEALSELRIQAARSGVRAEVAELQPERRHFEVLRLADDELPAASLRLVNAVP